VRIKLLRDAPVAAAMLAVLVYSCASRIDNQPLATLAASHGIPDFESIKEQ
jgi:hypothetical protein